MADTKTSAAPLAANEREADLQQQVEDAYALVARLEGELNNNAESIDDPSTSLVADDSTLKRVATTDGSKRFIQLHAI